MKIESNRSTLLFKLERYYFTMTKRNGRARHDKVVRIRTENVSKKRNGRFTKAMRRRQEQHAVEIRAALNRIKSLTDAQIREHQARHVVRLREKFWPVVAITAVEKMSPREYRQLLVSNLFRRHSEME